jgi:hypothetical protein
MPISNIKEKDQAKIRGFWLPGNPNALKSSAIISQKITFPGEIPQDCEEILAEMQMRFLKEHDL